MAKIRAAGHSALVGYLPAGFPTVEDATKAARAMVEAGADIVEIGFPYSDPVMDGPVIQRAAEQALAKGLRSADVLRTVEGVASAGAPVLVMTYWNPVLRYGVDAFARDLAAAGGAGLITPDLVPDEADDWLAASEAHGLDRVFLVAPSSSDERIASTVAATTGFVYAQSIMGVTGARETTSSAAPELVRRTREATDLPIGVGLGVRSGPQAAEIAGYADAVIVGSAMVKCLLDASSIGDGIASLRALTGELSDAVHA
ncbi:tryptophan synthase subunit alpha [Phytomonospora sp. NPDC050363]|uniref:tryptophan synthase subunit alpha n=1 Tax=Phytomonospora sp. NPDC050363 TaxID=3155642 RepID=UPI0033CBDE28